MYSDASILHFITISINVIALLLLIGIVIKAKSTIKNLTTLLINLSNDLDELKEEVEKTKKVLTLLAKAEVERQKQDKSNTKEGTNKMRVLTNEDIKELKRAI